MPRRATARLAIVGGELFKFMTGTQIVHVPYRGGAAAINDLIAGHVDMMFESLQSIAPLARSGKVRALGVSGASRSPAFPDLPTIDEAVYGSPPTWTGVIAPGHILASDRRQAQCRNQQDAQVGCLYGGSSKVIGDGRRGTPEEFAATMRPIPPNGETHRAHRRQTRMVPHFEEES